MDGPLDETAKTEVPCDSECGTIKIPPSSEAEILQPSINNGYVSILAKYSQVGCTM